jgi:hypothetical protein
MRLTEGASGNSRPKEPLGKYIKKNNEVVIEKIRSMVGIDFWLLNKVDEPTI